MPLGLDHPYWVDDPNFDLDYHVFVAADACAAYEPDLHEVALKTMGLNTAILTDSVEVAKAWKEAA